jgi:hypothetical protein
VAASALTSTRDAVAEIKDNLGSTDFQHIIAFFAIEHNAHTLVDAIGQAFPGVPVSGCSTAGEIGPNGMMQGGVLLIAFPHAGFRVHSDLIPDIDRFGVERATEAVRRLKAQLSPKADGLRRGNAFALLLVDGLSNVEETIVAAIHWEIDDIELVGGSAADGLKFGRTTLIHNGRVAQRAAILMMVESEFPFSVFKSQNFEPTPIKLVAGRPGVCLRDRAAARRPRTVQLRFLSASCQSRRRLLLPLNSQHERRRQPVVLLRHRRRASLHRGAAAGHASRHRHRARGARRQARRN